MKKKSNPIILGLLILVFSFGCTSKEMKKAKEFMDASMYEQAISLLEIEIQANPKNAEASYLLGKCYLETSNNNKVEECFKRAILLDTDLKENIGNIYFEKSLDLYKKSDFRYANSYYEEGLKYNPAYKDNFAKQLFDYTSEFSETTTETDNTKYLLSTIDQISPNYKSKIADLTYTLAKSFMEKGFVNEGLQYAEYGIKYDSKHIKDVADIYYKLANDLLTIQNKPNDCISFFERSIALNPEKKKEIGNILYNQAKVFETNNKTNLLLLFAKKSSEINPDYKSWYIVLKEKYKPKVPTEGLVAYYPFNGNSNDESRNSNNGLIHGATFTYDRKGEPNSAILFDGVNDYIECGSSSKLKVFNNSITISAWIKINGRGLNWGRIVLGGQVNTSYTLTQSKEGDRILWRITSGNRRFDVFSSSLDKAKWYHITAVYNGNKLIVYINGELDKFAYANGNINTNSKTIVIGGETGVHGGNPSKPSSFNGSIDDIRIYNKVLSSKEIKLLYFE